MVKKISVFVSLVALLSPLFAYGSVARTIVNPITGAPLNSAIMRNELQILENEIASLTVGAGSSTLMIDNNTFSGINKFSSAVSDFSGTWQTFSPSHFLTSLAGAASTTLLSDTNTFSTIGTTTYSGNVSITGNLKVSGSFYAPVHIVSSGDATINGALTVTGVTTLATSLNGAISAASGVLSAGTLSLSNGGTNASLSGANQMLFMNSGNTAVTSSANLTFDGSKLVITSASTTDLTASHSFFVAGNKITGVRGLTFVLSTTTVWTGTSTVASPYGDSIVTYAPLTGTGATLQCGASSGSLGVDIGDGGTHTFLIATSTANTNTFVFSFTAGDALNITGGRMSATTGTPTTTSCTLKYNEA